MSKSMTIRDVAKAAGVSPATVSRTFVHPEKVESVTRDRILALAKEMNYRPNAAARSLITGLTGNIGIVVPDLTNPFFPTIVRSVQRKAEQLGYSALLVDTGEDVQHEPELTENLARQVDGLVLCSPRMSDEKLIEISSRYPLVMINREIPEVPAVTIDNRSGIAQEVAHLKALGHHRIGYVAGPETSYSCLIRQQAASELLAEAGLEEVSIGRFEPTFDGGAQCCPAGPLVLCYRRHGLQRCHGFGAHQPADPVRGQRAGEFDGCRLRRHRVFFDVISRAFHRARSAQ
ncbi:LacI family DNA-binding transcriptional regulator [Glutamicibacter halophytocola]|uniref:LacI family DNA-binding transcriptional regulator n=1 Tax=Glutamicibacter halophytocola TaxID=1933880 RepID=UPI00321BF84D